MAMKPGNGGRNGERDPRLDGLYRDTPRDVPPAHLDAAILAAARREVGSRPRASPLRRWRVPVSIAAIVVLSVSLVTLVREEGGDSLVLMRDYRVPATPSDAQKTEPQQPVESPRVPESGDRSAAASQARKRAAPALEELTLRTDEIAELAAADARRTRERELARSSAKPAPRGDAPAGPDPATAPPAGAIGGFLSSQSLESAPRPEADAPQRQAPIGVRGSAADTTPPAAAPKPMPMEKRMQVEQKRMQVERKPLADKRPPVWRGLEQEPPQKWLERLAELRKQGRTGEAEELLAEIKRRFPDHPIPGGVE